MLTRSSVEGWMEKLKASWEAGDADAASALFNHTEQYYERPFKAATTFDEIQGYWKDIETLRDIHVEFSVVAIDGQTACIQWQNQFRTSQSAELTHLDGIFLVEFNDDGQCKVFRQWWFMEPQT